MYHLLAGLYSQVTQKPQFNVLLLGTSASGKTAWLDKVRGQVTGTGTRNLARITPTVGQNVVDLKLSAAMLHFWDLGGDAGLRRMWARYYDEAEALVWVMDARDWAATADVPPPKGDEEEGLSAIDAAEATRRRNESWGALADLRKNKHLASLPLLFVLTHIDYLSASQAAHFRVAIHEVMARKLPELASDEEASLDQELALTDGSEHGIRNSRGYWNDWHTVVCSAKTGEGVTDFVDWLHTRARRKRQERKAS